MPLWHVVMAVIKSNVQKSSKDISYSLSNSPQNVEVFLEEFFLNLNLKLKSASRALYEKKVVRSSQ